MRKEEKAGRIDIKATINKSKIINIEIQLENEHNMEKRSEFYSARLITDQFGKGDQYEELKPVILINILNYNLLKVPEYCTKTVTVAENHRSYEVIKDITYYFIELPKFRKSKPRLANLLECWLAVIDGENGGLIKMAEKKEKIIKEANEDVEEILSDEELKALMEYRQTAIWDENSRKAHLKERIKETEKENKKLERKAKKAEEKTKKLEEEAKKAEEKTRKAEEEARTAEEKIKKLEEAEKNTVKAMLKEGLSIEQIERISKISKQEIKQIEQEMK